VTLANPARWTPPCFFATKDIQRSLPGDGMNRLFTYFVVGSMILGVLVGWIINVAVPDADGCFKEIAKQPDHLITDVFLRLIKMIIAPLVFTTLVAGIAHMEDAASVGRDRRQDHAAGSSAPRSSR
jgi:hypothetical protein